MGLVLNIIISGLISGSVFALLAIGFSLIFGVARIVNIAHTAFYMVAAYCIYFVTHKMGFHPMWGMVAAIVLVALLGMISYKIFINPIREHEGAVLIATIALAMALQEIMILKFTGTYLSVPSLVKGYLVILGVKVFYQQLLTFCAALLVMAALWVLLMRTKLGLAIRSVAQDKEVANLMGINEARVAMMTMGISVGLAGFTGAIVVPLTILEPHMWMPPLIMMMAVVVLGGLGSLKGSFIGAYILGFAEALVVFLAPMGAFLKGPVSLCIMILGFAEALVVFLAPMGAFLKGSVALSIMILVLLIRPEGLFGVFFEEER